MDVKEKLVELANDILRYLPWGEIQKDTAERIADRMIDHGVTVGKPLVEHLHPIDAYEGLKGKYLVFKADTGEQVANCFVLRPDKDAAAIEALRAYAGVTDNETLAEDIYNWVGKGEPVQEWISVKDRLPNNEEHDWVLAQITLIPECIYGVPVVAEMRNGIWYDAYDETIEGKHEKVTHWMPLPQPPKGD